MRYERRYHRYDTVNKVDLPHHIEVYDQPWHLYVLHKWLTTVDLWLCRHQPFRAAYDALEQLDAWNHKRTCQGNCVTGMIRRRDPDTRRSVEFPNSVYCGHMPLSTRVDCWLFDLDRRKATTISTRNDE